MIRSTHIPLSKLSLALVAALAMAPAFAQSTSSGMTGVVTAADGKPVAGADVTITHVESGTVRHATTDANGRYAAQGLRVGGPYTVSIDNAAGTDTESNIYLELNQTSTVNAQLGAAATTLDTVTVTATRVSPVFSPANKGLGTNISGRALQTTPQGNRSIDDIARLDPRIQVTDQNDGSISVAGQPNRYNNITVDGLSQGDPFGLNANGMPYTGSPISPDTIAAYNISTTDFDAASDTVGANINAVTKSGTNEFHGSAYYAFTNASNMVGDLGGKAYGGYDTNKIMGATIGGPIVKDKLFFFLSYEDQKINGIAGVGTDAVTRGLLTTQQVSDVAQAFQSIGINTGEYGNSTATLQDKRTLAKLDWNISDRQRASFTYQRVEETKPTPYSSYAKDISVILPSNWYVNSSKTDNYSLQLFSDWTDNFSTEAKIGYQKFDNTQGAAINQPEVYACFTADPNQCTSYAGNATAPWVIAGEDRFRHENAITSKRLNATFAGTYYAGDHVIKGGFDYLSNEISDLFGSLLNGSYGFYDKNGDGSVVDEIRAGNYGFFSKNYLADGVTLADMAGTWKYTQISPFIQDTWQATDRLSLTFGVRVDIPGADRAPPVAVEGLDKTGNPAPGATPGAPVWESRFGYPSNTTLGSRNKVIEPRFSFNYTFDSPRPMQLRGGIGLFQSTPPYVWLTNPYMNNGVVGSKGYSSNDPIANPFNPDPANQPGPTSAVAGQCAPGANCQIDVLDPDFKLPTVWKASLAFDAQLPWWGLVGSIEWQHLKNKDAIAYLAPNIGVPNGSLPDGRASYWTGNFGTGKNNGSFPEIYYRSTLLTNTDKGGSDAFTLSLGKPLDHGFSGNISATYTRATEVNPGKSSQAWSNYNYVTYINPNELNETRSSYVIPKSLKAALNWEHAFFGDYRTTVSLYYNGRTGLPYSWTFGTDVNGDNVSNTDLAYIPMRNDARVSYGNATQDQINAFQAFIDNDPYLRTHRGQIASRNSTYQPWSNQLDLGVQQEFPGFFKGNKSILRFDVFNLLNLLDKDWGQVNTVGFFGTRRLTNVSAVVTGPDGKPQYVYDLGPVGKPSWQNLGVYDTYANPARVVSRWSVLMTVKYTF